jgi:hypothetical protein
MVVTGNFRSQSELRKSRRKQFHRPASVLLAEDSPPRSCTIEDISDTGARITLECDGDLPEEFTLLLTANGATHRRCRVVWRTGLTVGVQFPARTPGS